jgi:hypothetical protein
MQQAAFSLPLPTSTIETLIKNYEAADAEKSRVYALAANAADDDVDAAEAACGAAYDAVEGIADVILATPIGSATDVAIKARVLLARGADAADLFHYRPEDLTQFVQELRGLARL